MPVVLWLLKQLGGALIDPKVWFAAGAAFWIGGVREEWKAHEQIEAVKYQAADAAAKREASITAERKYLAGLVDQVNSRTAAAVKVEQEAHDAQIKVVSASLGAALERLRSEQARNTDLAHSAASAPVVCRDYAADPTRLSVADAEFLERDAARADRLAADYAYVRGQYETVKQQLDNYAQQVAAWEQTIKAHR